MKKKRLAAVKQYIAATEGLKRIEMLPDELKTLKEEAGVKPEDRLEIDGIEFHELSKRGQLHALVLQYAAMRWGQDLSFGYVTTLLKAVPDDDMKSLAAVIIDQDMDSRDVQDPLEDMPEPERSEHIKAIEELGLGRVES